MLVAHCKALEARGPIASHSAGPPGPAALLLALEGRASVAVTRRLPATHQHPHEHQQHQEWTSEHRSVDVDGPEPVGFVTLRRPQATGTSHAFAEPNPEPVPQTGTAVPGLPWVNSQVASTCLVRHLPLKCHSIEGGTRFHIRKMFMTWSPLTESNRRPSPYHGPLCGSAAPGRSPDLREHEHTLALTSAGRAHASTICHSICHSL